MNKEKIKTFFQDLLVFCIGILFILGGLQVMFFGYLEHTSASDSIYEFNFFERIIGVFPILFGGVVVYIMGIRIYDDYLEKYYKKYIKKSNKD